jgi:hypothetical protein
VASSITSSFDMMPKRGQWERRRRAGTTTGGESGGGGDAGGTSSGIAVGAVSVSCDGWSISVLTTALFSQRSAARPPPRLPPIEWSRRP